MKTPIRTLALVAGLLTASLTAQGVPAPYSENMDTLAAASPTCSATTSGGLPTGWALDATSTLAWHADSGGTTSSATGPSVDNTTGTATGQYLYTETSCSTGTWVAVLNVVGIDTTTLTNPTCEFAYHMYGAAMGTLELQEFDGVNWNTIWTLSGDQGDQWFRAAATVSFNTNLQLRFVGTRGTSFTSDMAIDDFFVGDPTPRAWELNDAAATFEINGIANSDAFAAAPVVQSSAQFACATVVPLTGTFRLASNVTNSAYELGYQAVLPVAAGAGAIVTAGNQFINLDFSSSTLAFVNGGVAPALRAAPGNNLPGAAGFDITVPYSMTPPFLLAMQGVCIDPSNIDGFAATAASTIEGTLTAAPTTIPLTLGDDASANVDLVGNCLTTGGITFAGTNYSSMDVISNGRVMFGGADVDFSPSQTEALADNPFIGYWTDLNPGAGGNIDVNNLGGGIIQVAYTNVIYFGGTTPTSFSFDFDTNTGVITMNVAGITMNPALSSGGANVFMGVSPGLVNGATDPGLTLFTSGGAGAPAGLADMTYDFTDPGLSGNAFPASLMGTTPLTNITFIPVGGGTTAYAWTAL